MEGYKEDLFTPFIVVFDQASTRNSEDINPQQFGFLSQSSFNVLHEAAQQSRKTSELPLPFLLCLGRGKRGRLLAVPALRAFGWRAWSRWSHGALGALPSARGGAGSRWDDV